VWIDGAKVSTRRSLGFFRTRAKAAHSFFNLELIITKKFFQKGFDHF